MRVHGIRAGRINGAGGKGLDHSRRKVDHLRSHLDHSSGLVVHVVGSGHGVGFLTTLLSIWVEHGVVSAMVSP